MTPVPLEHKVDESHVLLSQGALVLLTLPIYYIRIFIYVTLHKYKRIQYIHRTHHLQCSVLDKFVQLLKHRYPLKNMCK